ncbi:MAG: hypothetical protein H6745_20365 [Deltaproteobacteria bacterium]|nr:hypothetical protein [Deltaproteobacteria bacterium]
MSNPRRLARHALSLGLCLLAVTALGEVARATCSDGVQNGTETGVDCGGSSCLACDGDACSLSSQCKSGSCVDDICSTVFSLDTSQGTTAAQPGGAAVVVDPTLTIAGAGTLSGARVLVASGFNASEDTLAFTSQAGISGSYDAASGVLTLSGSATVAAYQAALRTVTYRHASAAGTTADRVVTFSLGDNGLPLESNGHFYEYVTKPSGVSNPGVPGEFWWQTARTLASQRRYFGLQGYLVTVTNGAENAFVAAKLNGQGWMGATDEAVEGDWRWVTGPEGLEESGAGRLFYHGLTDTGYPYPELDAFGVTRSCALPSDCESGVCIANACYQYDNWNHTSGPRSEPNNCCTDSVAAGEDYGHFLVDAQWNDYYTINQSIAGYVVEYGGMPNDPPLVLQDNKTVRIVAVSCSNSLKDGTETDVDCGGSCGPCTAGQVCSVNGDCTSFNCNLESRCVAPSCSDGIRNGTETAVDCGGSCTLDCADGLGCNSNGDCVSGKCTQNVCQAPTCGDSVKNQGETDVDCGGPCAPCANGNQCVQPSDCQSEICAGNVCQSASCTDGVQNGSETDLNCGGGVCAACDDGQACLVPNDCQSQVCTSGSCVAPSCSDGVKNGDETGLNCGGSCPARCAPGGGCLTGDDCDTGVCSNGTCDAATCLDGVRNGDETGVDCGGPTCGDCGAGEPCAGAGDCLSGVCDGVCQAPSCTDQVANGDETAQDCGGSCGATCAPGVACKIDGDCDSGVCDALFCAEPACDDLVHNGGETGVDCGGATGCPPCADGGACALGTDCESDVCGLDLTCAAPTCQDGVANGDETDLDCGGVDCSPCGFGLLCDGAGDCADDTCANGRCACPEGKDYNATSGRCLGAGECGAVMTCEVGTTDVVFYGVVSDASGPVGSVRCVRAATGGVTCDADASGQLIVYDVLWCQ